MRPRNTKEFELHVKFQRPIDGSDYDHFIDAFIDFVESRGMMIGGMGGRLPLIETTGMVLADKGLPSDKDRKILIEWLLARNEVENAAIES